MGANIGQKAIEEIARQMVKEGLITADQLAICEVSHENLGEDLGHLLVKKKYPVDAELAKRLPLHVARRYHLVPAGRTPCTPPSRALRPS